MRSRGYQEMAGEFIGTAILVFFGCGSVAVSVLFSAHVGLMQVAMVWGMAVALAIYATRHLSGAHLNPAVSVAMTVAGRLPAARLPIYLASQFLGGFFAAALLYLLFGASIAHFEALHDIVRGAPESIRTAMMFGEFFPNPGAGEAVAVSAGGAFFAEALGTFVLVFMIFSLTDTRNGGRPGKALAPVFIGATVTIIIAVIAPLTQAGLNPARDFSPRMFSVLAGWGHAALPGFSHIAVYVLGPVAGALVAAFVFTRLVEPLMKGRSAEPSGAEGHRRPDAELNVDS